MRILTVTLCLILSIFMGASFAGTATQKATLLEANATANALEAQPAATPQFPLRRPSVAARGVFAWFDERFEIYFWRQDSHAWIQIVPLGSEAFICNASFRIIQNRASYDTVQLVSLASSFQCGDVSRPTIFWFTQYEHEDEKANLAKAFIISFDGHSAGTFRLAIPAAAPGTVIDPPEDDDGPPEPGDDGCFIQTLKK